VKYTEKEVECRKIPFRYLALFAFPQIAIISTICNNEAADKAFVILA